MPGNPEQNDMLIDRYLNRQMNDAEIDAFEQRMFEDEQLFMRVQLLDAFKTSLAQQHAALDRQTPALPRTFAAWMQQPLSRVAALLVVGLGLQSGYGLMTKADTRRAVGIDTTFVLEATRGANAITLTGAPPYLFQVDAGLEAAASPVSAVLRNADGEELLHIDTLPVDANGWARVLYGDPLSGRYSLELSNADGATLRDYALTIND